MFLLIGLMICVSPIKAIEPSPRNASGLGEAYGFVLGQNLTLQRIADDYPDLAREALLAKLEFQRTFGDIHANLEPKLVEFLGEEVFKAFRAKLENQLMDMAQGEETRRILAENFLEEVRNRARGDIYSPTKDRAVSVQCSVGALESDHELVEGRFARVKPLCAQIFNSVVIPELYLAPEKQRGKIESVMMPTKPLDYRSKSSSIASLSN
ncbi:MULTISPECIES: hypothetical protein [Marinobacter]|uniref:Uncharacterized protein n=1 Tax=Marinobacter xiaoshiensis TaxID=3073652 RepID=A0ABU2HH31_9GAMM|nr:MULTISPECIES: hypothetical protein [unclassified Marinobacter]MBK1887820.1 hypothetical protein [Marinobacter sp. DY40_1A1]MDS1310352.1 hypothetical protein [Marinobacter sp. F60267]